MKLLKKLFLILLGLLIFIVLAIIGYAQWYKPSYEGELTLKGLQEEVSCYVDDYGVPHIYAKNEQDAMRALGYMHAKERLWQMELMRRIAPGKLSEVFGKETLELDLFFAALGIEEHNQVLMQNITPNHPSKALIAVYLEGVNQSIENEKTPIEFLLTGVNKTQFTELDIYNIYGYMAFSFAMAQKTDPLLTEINQKWGADYLFDFGLDGKYFTTQLGADATEMAEISAKVVALLNNSPVPAFIGSNSWVIGSQKTQNKKVIFANDPHIMFSQPGTWYETHIHTSNYEIYGYYIPGTPFPLLGHNRNYAYGLTMLENDDIDFYQLENAAENKIFIGDSVAAITLLTKKIKVKGEKDREITVKKTPLGPVMTGFSKHLPEKQELVMWWIYLQEKHQMMEALYGLSHVNQMEDYVQSVSKIAAPGLNVMYGDAQGNIAWVASGKLYQMQDSVNTYQILQAKNKSHLQRKYLPFESNPKSINPEKHYVYSANNQPKAVDGYLYPGYYLPKDRAQRIIDLLEAKDNWTKEDVSHMMVDDHSDVAVELARYMSHYIEREKLNKEEEFALQFLLNWDGNHHAKEIGPTVFNKWIYFYLKNTFEDELGEKGFQNLLETHVMKQMIPHQIKNTASVWWDNVSTKDKVESKKEILVQSFHQAVASLDKQLGKKVDKWTWDRVHVLEHQHPFGKISLLRRYFNVGTFGVSGSNEVINNLMFTYSDNKKHIIKAGPSTRRIIDFSDVEGSWSILPTGQSGNFMSKHYKDQAKMYANGVYRKMLLNQKEIQEISTLIQFVVK
ncbi:MAG: penicillin acylase family protein [Flavobacterium sp.]